LISSPIGYCEFFSLDIRRVGSADVDGQNNLTRPKDRTHRMPLIKVDAAATPTEQTNQDDKQI
jgi:hypothetical protein